VAWVPVVRWRGRRIVLWSAQAMDVSAIARMAFTPEDRVREVIHNFSDDGFASLDARYAGGRPPKFTLPQRQQINRIALSRPSDHDLPFSTWSLSKLAELLVADDISHEGHRAPRGGRVAQRLKRFKVSNDPDYERNRVLELYPIADGSTSPGPDDPTVITRACMGSAGVWPIIGTSRPPLRHVSPPATSRTTAREGEPAAQQSNTVAERTREDAADDMEHCSIARVVPFGHPIDHR
jgi:transposase